MTIETLRAFFMWCTVINVGLLLISTLVLLLAQDFVYRVHSKFFSIPREMFNVVIYCFIGFFKLIVIVFNLVPYVALLILS